MVRYIPYLLDLAGAGGLLFFIAFVSWTKMDGSLGS